MKIRQLIFVILFISLLASCTQNTGAVPASTAVDPIHTATATVIPTATLDPIVEAQNAGLLYSQDFETGSDEGIYDFAKENFEVIVDDSGNHIYCNKGSIFHSLAHFGAESWTNYGVEFRFKFVHFGDPATMELFARMDKRANGYAGEIDQRNESIGLRSNPNGKVVKTHSIVPVVEQWYTLRMELVGSRIQFFVDNKLMEEMTDTDYSRGKAAFDVAPSTLACVDDIRAWALTDDGQIAQLPDKPEPRSLTDRLISHRFPKLFYVSQDYNPAIETLTSAYYYDILLFDKEVTKTESIFLGPAGMIRSQNPNAILLAAHSNQEFVPDDGSLLGRGFVAGLKPEWVMQDIDGNPFPAFDYGKYWSTMINLSTDVTTYLPEYLNQKVISTGLFDGIFYDGTVETWWQADPAPGRPFGPVDFNRDGIADTPEELTAAMDTGVQKMLLETRKDFPADTLITGNAGWSGSLLLADDAKEDTVFADLLNGRMIEGFLNWEKYDIDWLVTMRAYYLMQEASVDPKTPLIMAYCSGDDDDHLRYVLASSLMFDGYFNCTNDPGFFSNAYPSRPYTANWWYDEYSVDLSTGKAVQSLDARGYLGLPLTEAYNTNDQTDLLTAALMDNDPKAMRLAWRRDFEHGIVLINPSRASKDIKLNGTYKKILGTYDPQFNDGSEVTKITLPPQSGVILLNP